MKTCDICGSKFDIWDKQEDFGIRSSPGYGSKYDGEHIDIDLCCKCFDKIIDIVIPMCKESPFKEV